MRRDSKPNNQHFLFNPKKEQKKGDDDTTLYMEFSLCFKSSPKLPIFLF